MLNKIVSKLFTKNTVIILLIVLLLVVLILLKIVFIQSDTIDSKNKIIELKDETICNLQKEINTEINKFNELSKTYSNIDEKYKDKINNLLMENKKYEDIIKDIENYTIDNNAKFNSLLQEYSNSTGYRIKQNLSK